MMKKLKIFCKAAFILLIVLLVQCNFTEVREVKQVEYMYFKANGVERICQVYVDSVLFGSGRRYPESDYSDRSSCSIQIDSLAPKRLWIDSNSAEYYYRGYYYSCGNLSDSIIIEFDSVNQCYFGHFSFIAVSKPNNDDDIIYIGPDPKVPDTTRDTVRITDGVFIYSSKKDTVE